MLQSALKLIADGDAISSEELANRLDVRPEVVREALSQLVRLGYLRPSGDDGTCKTACAGCAVADHCFGRAQLWALTEKGRRAAAAA